tara:strand:- start:108 stop:299 length:192 start_codon:yes stop_codon:yes gene_type:complete
MNKINVKLTKEQVAALLEILEGEDLGDIESAIVQAEANTRGVKSVVKTLLGRDVFVRDDRGWC